MDGLRYFKIFNADVGGLIYMELMRVPVVIVPVVF